MGRQEASTGSDGLDRRVEVLARRAERNVAVHPGRERRRQQFVGVPFGRHDGVPRDSLGQPAQRREAVGEHQEVPATTTSGDNRVDW
ncbi:hypothetical protein SCALM49S_10040 [Streptomyces californicus]